MTSDSPIVLNRDPYKQTAVFKQTITGRKYCIKEQVFSSLSAANEALREGILQCRVNHPCVCKVYNSELRVGQGTEIVSRIWMELMEEDVATAIHNRMKTNSYWPEPQLRSIAKGLIDALALAQRQEISHRDLKLANLLTNSAGDLVKICDFGCAKWSPELIEYHTITGTPLFFSPQLARAFAQYLLTGNAQVHHNPYKSDVYALGVCLLHMAVLKLSIKIPAGNNTSGLLKEVVSIGYSPQMKQLLEGMLNFDEENRMDFVGLSRETERLFEERVEWGWGSIGGVEVGETDVNLPVNVAVIQKPEDGGEFPSIRTLPWDEDTSLFASTFDHAESDSDLVSYRDNDIGRDSTIMRALCVVCKLRGAGLDLTVSFAPGSPMDIYDKAASVCSQDCLRAILPLEKCLICGRLCLPDASFARLACDDRHLFCQKYCFLIFVAKHTNNFKETRAITCPKDGATVEYEYVYRMLGGKGAFCKLSFTIRTCGICLNIKSYYQLPCNKHWLCVNCFEEAKAQKFRCRECEQESLISLV